MFKVTLLLKLLKHSPLNFILFIIQKPFKERIKIYFEGDWLYYNSDKTTLYHLVHSIGKLHRMIDFLPSKMEGVMIDGGANNGIFTLLLSKKFNNKIYSFEASNKLSEIIKINTNSKNVEVINKAISTETGEVEFHIDENSDQTGSIILENVEEFASKNNAIKSFTVDAVSLVDFVENKHIYNVGVLKLDIQGGEYDALKNAESVLIKTDILILECLFIEPTFFDLLDLVRRYYNNHLVINQVAYGADIIFYKDHISLSK